jgi:hypothetical protein
VPQRRCVATVTGTHLDEPEDAFEDNPVEPVYESLIPGMSREDPAYPHAVRALLRLAEAGFDAKDPELARRAADVGREQLVAVPAVVPVKRIRKWSGWVYYMRIGNRCKIGYTTNLTRRMLVVVPEEVLAIEPGTLETEVQRHDEFSQLRTHAEWFRLEGPLVAHVARVASEMDEATRRVVAKAIRPQRGYRTHIA